MSKRRRQSYSGCSVNVKRGRLRLRFRVVMPDGTNRQVARATGYADTAENRVLLRPLAKLVGAALEAGRTLAEIDEILKAPSPANAPSESRGQRGPGEPAGPTVADYYLGWIKEQEPLARKAQARDYRRHMRGYILPAIGNIPLSTLKASDVRGLQADLLARGLSVKYVRNIISGTLRAMVHQALVDELVTRDVFAGVRWPAWDPPEPDPFTAEERTRILEWFQAKRFGFSPGRGSTEHRWLAHPDYHGFVMTLFWTGMRPSEVAGLTWSDIDLANACLYVRRSRHLFQYAAPKTRQARRRVELFPELVRVLRALQPLHVAPETPVFKNTRGLPIEPNSLLPHWYRCLRALGIRQRGLYTMKDTFVTMALSVGVKIPWLEQQTGVRYDTLRRHYGRWVPQDRESELQRFATYEPGLFRANCAPRKRQRGHNSRQLLDFAKPRECERGDLNPHGSYPTGS
jgi:integrase